MNRTVIALLALLLGVELAQAQPALSPRELIDALGVQIRQILEDPKRSKTWQDIERAEQAVALQISSLARSAPGDDALIDADAQGRTPLMLAASGGYRLVVAALLADPIVRVRINAADKAGETAWMVASFAPALTLVACQPGTLTLERFPLLPPYLRRMSILLGVKDAAATATAAAIVRSLEQAGAAPDPQAARQAWLARCPNTSPELRQALTQGPLLTTLVDHALAQQARFSRAYREGAASIPQKPPGDMRFINAAPAMIESARQLKCTGRVVPALRGALPWQGKLLFKVTAATRAGVVEVADLELLPGGEPSPQVADYFRSLILQALAGYRCEGDHVFTQEFSFKVE